mmetsp:Transcript_5072/g.9386  ORF Transcript_5072/g.9386 Transcript_5072/m.9386 type:complete len:217 (+) Transcript_5072:477-1127(+)
MRRRPLSFSSLHRGAPPPPPTPITTPITTTTHSKPPPPLPPSACRPRAPCRRAPLPLRPRHRPLLHRVLPQLDLLPCPSHRLRRHPRLLLLRQLGHPSLCRLRLLRSRRRSPCPPHLSLGRSVRTNRRPHHHRPRVPHRLPRIPQPPPPRLHRHVLCGSAGRLRTRAESESVPDQTGHPSLDLVPPPGRRASHHFRPRLPHGIGDPAYHLPHHRLR